MSTRAAIAAAFVAMLLPATAGAQPGVSVESGIGNDQSTTVTPLSVSVDRGNSTDTLLVLDRLHSYGYTINTAERADRAIRSWQKSNRLVVDGIAGSQTLGSLGLLASASEPAVRVDPPAAPSVDTSVEGVIREAWPDELEDHALRIAMRESRLQPGAINANHDATGLFQLMWSVHRRWLCPQMGVCTQAQLLDARTNAEAAYALYLRDGGWGPWSL